MIDHPGLAVLDQEGDLRRRQPEVHRHRDGAEQVGGQECLDEFGAVEHQDHHPVAELHAAAAQRIGECGHPPVAAHAQVVVCPRYRSAVALGLHQRVPGQLIRPVLPARQVRLLGGRVTGQTVGPAVRSTDRVSSACALSRCRLARILHLIKHGVAPVTLRGGQVSGQVHRTASKDARERTRRGTSAGRPDVVRAASNCPTRSPPICAPRSCPARCVRARSSGSTTPRHNSVSASPRCARRC